MDMSTELFFLAWTTAITTLMWLPGFLNMFMDQGVMAAFSNRDSLAPLAPWAERANRAHRNAVENLVVFAALVLVIQAAGMSNATTELACQIYFWLRVIHYLSYLLGIIYVRSIAWTLAWVCLVVLAVQVVF